MNISIEVAPSLHFLSPLETNEITEFLSLSLPFVLSLFLFKPWTPQRIVAELQRNARWNSATEAGGLE